jgi:hypothetical protein
LAQASLANREEKWALLQGRDSYLPHPVMLQVKQELAARGLPVLLGSEWLAAHPCLRQGAGRVLCTTIPSCRSALSWKRASSTRCRQAARITAGSAGRLPPALFGAAKPQRLARVRRR